MRCYYYYRVVGGVRVATNAAATRFLSVERGAKGAGDEVPHPRPTTGLVATQCRYHHSSRSILLPLSGNSQAKVSYLVKNISN